MSTSRSPDALVERLARRYAGATSRRSFVARLAAVMIAAPVIPLLPVRRARAAEPGLAEPLTEFARKAQTHDDRACDYWRYCAIDGSLCSCCGGGPHTCPPGTKVSPTSWVGTCRNPDDGKTYLIAYRDCCGVGDCGQCKCDNSDRETPIYRPQTNNDVLWCFGLESMTYHCSTAVLVGEA